MSKAKLLLVLLILCLLPLAGCLQRGAVIEDTPAQQPAETWTDLDQGLADGDSMWFLAGGDTLMGPVYFYQYDPAADALAAAWRYQQDEIKSARVNELNAAYTENGITHSARYYALSDTQLLFNIGDAQGRELGVQQYTLLLAGEEAIWTLDAQGKANRIDTGDWREMEYADQIAAEFPYVADDQDNSPYVIWNYRLQLSPDRAHLAFMSNRDQFPAPGGYSLWTVGITDREVKRVAGAEGKHFSPLGWLDAETMLCWIDRDLYAVTLAGDLFALHPGEELEYVDLLGLSGGLIAVREDGEAQTKISFYTWNSLEHSFKPYDAITLPGLLQIMGLSGDALSTDGSCFAALYAPDANSAGSLLYLRDLDSGGETIIDQAPDELGEPHSFNWIGPNTLYISFMQRGADGGEIYHPWLYNL